MALTSAFFNESDLQRPNLASTSVVDRAGPRRQEAQCSLTVFNVREAAAYLKIAPSTLYKIVSAGAIAFSKPGGKILRFLRSDLDEYILRHRREAIDVIAEQREEGNAPRPAPRLRGRREVRS